jgi:tetratricopeptide (TPR) repeat protein
MRKYFLIGLFFIQCSFSALPQNIDSLKNVLPSLKDTTRIDILNKLSYFYILAEQKDSAKHYATLAGQEARKSNYIHGIAVSFGNLAHIVKHFDDDFIQAEKYIKESLQWYERTKNKAGIYTAYYYLQDTRLAQSKFDEIIDFGKKDYAAAKQRNDTTVMIARLRELIIAYKESGNYEQSFLAAQEKHELPVAAKKKIPIQGTNFSIAALYQAIEDYPDALIYYRKVLASDDDETRAQRVRAGSDIWFKMEFAEVFSHHCFA